jgi:hypothetical protein
MAHCSNCQKPITCGCQKRTASDGRSCCSTCITAYENSIGSNKMRKNVEQLIWDIPKGHIQTKR